MQHFKTLPEQLGVEHRSCSARFVKTVSTQNEKYMHIVESRLQEVQLKLLTVISTGVQGYFQFDSISALALIKVKK